MVIVDFLCNQVFAVPQLATSNVVIVEVVRKLYGHWVLQTQFVPQLATSKVVIAEAVTDHNLHCHCVPQATW